MALAGPTARCGSWTCTTERSGCRFASTTAELKRPWSELSAVAFVDGGKSILSAGRDNVQTVWNAATGQEVAAPNGHHSWVEVVAQSRRPADRHGRAGQLDPSVGRRHVQTPGPAPGHFETIWDLDVSLDGRRVVTAGGDGTALVWTWPAAGRSGCSPAPGPATRP